MPKLNIGEDWEQKYRLKVRYLSKGLRCSSNGKKNVGTQLFWIRYLTRNQRRTDYVSSIELPWKKEEVNKNLHIIRDAVKLANQNPSKPFKYYMNLVIKKYKP
mgnify:CR=1 FL=1